FGLQLDQLREALLLYLHADADRVERALHQLVELAIALRGLRVVADDERAPVRLVPIAVRSLAVAIALGEGGRGARIVLDGAHVLRIVAGDAGRNRILRADRLAFADDADLVVDPVGHRDRTPQGDALGGEAANRIGRAPHAILHVEVMVDDLRIDAAVELN